MANGPVNLEMVLPPNGEVSLLRGSDSPLAGWVSRAYDRIVPSTTVTWRGRIEPGEELETRIRRA